MQLIIAQQDHEAKHWLNLESSGAAASQMVWVKCAATFSEYPDAEGFIDIDFDGHFFSPIDKPLLINETNRTIREIDATNTKLARFCGWKTFLERPIWELATTSKDTQWIEPIINLIGRKYELVADEPGLVAPRILSMLINEAFHAAGEGVSSEKEIDLAMKLGTNYPYGPFEWANIVDIKQIAGLLRKLAAKDHRYMPHPQLNIF